MKMIVIATICNPNKTIEGYRIMDKETGNVIDVTNAQVLAVLKKKTPIEGLKLEAGKIKGSNGSLDRYTKITKDGNPIPGVNGLVILMSVDDVGFRFTDFNARIRTGRKENMIALLDEGEYTLANGKVVDGPSGKFISSIVGTYENLPLEELKKQANAKASDSKEVAKQVVQSREHAKEISIIKSAYSSGEKLTGGESGLNLLRKVDERCGLDVEQKVAYMEWTIKKTRPFYYYIMAALKRKFTLEIETMAVSIDTFYMNPNFIYELSLPDLIFVGLHEIMHTAMMHPLRGLKKDHECYNLAADYFVNEHIIDEFRCPRDGTPVKIMDKFVPKAGSKVTTDDRKPVAVYSKDQNELKTTIALPQSACVNVNVDLKTDTVETLYNELISIKQQAIKDLMQQLKEQEQNGQGGQQSGGQSGQGGQQGQGQQGQQGQSGQGGRQGGQGGQQGGQGGGQSSAVPDNLFDDDLTGEKDKNKNGGGQGSSTDRVLDANGRPFKPGQIQSSQGQGNQDSQNGQGGQDGQEQSSQGQSGQGQGGQGSSGSQGNGQGSVGSGSNANIDETGKNGQGQGSVKSSTDNRTDGSLDGNKSNTGSGNIPGMNDGQVHDGADTKKGKRNEGILNGKYFRGVEIKAGLSDDLVSDSSTAVSNEQAKQISKSILQQAITNTQRSIKGWSPNSGDPIERMIIESLAPKINWRTLLRSKLTYASQKVNTFSSPDKRYKQLGHIVPGPKKMENDTLENVKVCIDTSGSISDQDIGIALAQIEQLLNTFKAKAELIYWDTEVRAVYEFKDIRELLSKKPMGGGGTDPNCIFDYFETNRDYKIGRKKKPDIVIIFTDGYFGQLDAAYKKYTGTIWVINNGIKDFKAPFGKVAPFKVED